MHVGRFYRRINPPDWFRSLSPYYCPAVQWDILADWNYAGIDMVTRPPFRVTPSAIDMKAGFVEWAGKFTAGVYDFGWKHRFQLKKSTPGIEVSFRIVDNVGSLMQGTILASPTNFYAGNFSWGAYGSYTVLKSGLWGGINDVQYLPVSYHNEKP